VTPSGPLFAMQLGEHGFWLRALPVATALPAAALLLWGLVRGRPLPALGGAAAFLATASVGLASLLVFDDSRRVAFCGSCHVMQPLAASLTGDDGSLAGVHFRRGLVPHDTACFTCHSGYGIWGGMRAKRAGVMHMVHTVTGGYELPLHLNAPFDISSCLGCHLEAESFRAVEMHQSAEVQQALASGEMGCTGACHPAAHPESALGGGGPAS